MRQQLEIRLAQLGQELQAGKKALVELDSQAIALKSQMLRINGAIQVLEELLVADAPIEEVSPKPVAVGQ